MLEVGRATPRFDAKSKVTGEEKYAIDHYPENMLWAGVKRGGIPHGVIREVDVSAALSLPGVFRVLTRKDVPGTNRQGIVHKDQPVLAGSRVRHRGDPVALVLAEDKKTLAKALELIVVKIEPIPAVFDPEEALEPDAPHVHEEGNILLKAEIAKGKGIDEAFEECDFVVEESLEVPFQDHAFIETQNGVAWQEPDGKIVMIASTQAPFRDRFEIAHALGLSPGSIRVISPFLGGGFGGKDGATVQCLLALGALKASGRPVKMIWDREECFIAGYKRHAARMVFRLGAKANGTLHALHCRLYYDSGPYAHLSGEVMELGMEHAGGPYRIANTLIEGWCVYTNNPIGGAMRGFGACQVSFAVERMMDSLAAKLGMDKLQFRLKNALQRGDTNCAGVTMVNSTGIVPCLEGLSAHPLWVQREQWKKSSPPFKKRGVGVAAVHNAMGYGRGLPDSAIAKVELTTEGKFRIYCGVSDMGQGNSSAFAQIAGEILCQDERQLELVQPDTEKSLPSGSSSAGRTTYTYGNALIKACRDLKEKLFHRTSLLLLLDEPKGLALLPGRVSHLPSGREVPLPVLAGMFPESDRTCISQFIMPVSQHVPDTGKAFFLGFPHSFFSFAAHLACIEVDELTGKIDVLRYVAFTEGGRVINPQGFEQQVQGAVAQGIGYALFEKVHLDNGEIRNPNFSNYILPTSLDIPDIASIAVETVEPTGPFGMKGVGEVGMNAPLPAIAGAIENALGIRLNKSPFSAGPVLESIGRTRSCEGAAESRYDGGTSA
ncbi:MAG: xanthine dehydrogenase family protein molybdopterin-binding subunit [Syntrophobacteraceae bacterium]